MFLAVAHFGAGAGAAGAAAGDQGHYVADVDGRIFLNAAALRSALAGPHVLPHAVDTFDHAAILGREDAQDLAGLALVAASDHYDVVATSNMSCHNGLSRRWWAVPTLQIHCHVAQTTSLASETIFMK